MSTFKAQLGRSVRVTRATSGERIRSSPSARISRLTRFSTRQPPEEYKIRKSLADYVQEELELQGRQLFYQRVSVLARNLAPARDPDPDPDPPAADPEADPGMGPETSPEAVAETEAEAAETELEPGPRMAAKDDFKARLQERLEVIVERCHAASFTKDSLTGLFLCMGDYTLLVVEGTEDMVGDFFVQLAAETAAFWAASRVLLVEDRIGQIYFDAFICRRSGAVNVNEKFPAATPNDEFLMGEQHRKLRARVRELCEALARKLSDQDEPAADDQLPPEEFNRLLPEVQRVELLLSSTRFYRSAEEHAATYGHIPMVQDEEALVWPVPSDFTPVGVFRRSPYDVNLTFSDYGKEDDDRRPSEAPEPAPDAEEEAGGSSANQ